MNTPVDKSVPSRQTNLGCPIALGLLPPSSLLPSPNVKYHVELSKALREALVNNLETFLDALSDTPDLEMVATYVIDQLETYLMSGIDDIVVELEESGALDGSLQTHSKKR